MVTQQYDELLKLSGDALAHLSADPERLELFAAAHNEAVDLDLLSRLLINRVEEPMYKLALLEYQQAVFSTSIAQYRQAHKALRLFLELSLCSILFSAHEIDTHLWLRGKKDANWKSINCENTGVFSRHFVGAFFEEMADHCDQYQSLASKLYRECSEYVHGNWQSFGEMNHQIAYNANSLETWADRADTARLLVKFAFVCRYLKNASSDTKNELEEMVLEDFGNLPAVQSIFEEEPDE
ncbi:hypothetical protein KBY25_16490 [Ruegeria pomeroyi]|nr:hypothetical protein [Ruegeria pomeroyi]